MCTTHSRTRIHAHHTRTCTCTRMRARALCTRPYARTCVHTRAHLRAHAHHMRARACTRARAHTFAHGAYTRTRTYVHARMRLTCPRVHTCPLARAPTHARTCACAHLCPHMGSRSRLKRFCIRAFCSGIKQQVAHESCFCVNCVQDLF